MAPLVYSGFNLFDYLIIPYVAKHASRGEISNGGAPLATLSGRDRLFVAFSKLVTTLFIYHCGQFLIQAGALHTALESSHSLRAVLLLPVYLPLLFLAYDFFYTLFHWALHMPALYPWIHKHHHRQVAPFRGNTDGINVHPVEYIIGEYLHLACYWMLGRVVGHENVHPLTMVVFIAVGGTLASLNHTRYDVQFLGYSVRAHDHHHRQPRCNFGQYTMFWDRVFGTYMPDPK